MKSFRCKIGYHDWETIDKKQIEEIVKDYNEKNLTEIDLNTEKYYAYNNICMRCNKNKDEIKEYEHRVFQLDRRHKIALERYEKED
jgi:hypothetical protein